MSHDLREHVWTTARSIGTLATRDTVKTKVVSFAITTAVIVGLTVASTSGGGVVTTLTGDEEVERDETVTLNVTIEHGDTELDAEGHLLTITDQNGDAIEQVFTFDGTPVVNVSNSTKIDEQKLDPTLEIGTEATLQRTVGSGYEVGAAGYEVGAAGYEVGTQADEDASQTITYTITLNASAFEANEYDAQVELITEQFNESYTPPADTWPSEDLETAYASNVHTFEITNPDDGGESYK